MAYPSWLPILLGALTAVGPLSTDMYLPAFPVMEQSLGVQPGSAQITLATWFLGLAVGQLTQGALADRYGRRRPLIVGAAIYVVANMGCALAPNLATLAGLRFVAAFGGSALMVIPRAIVRDIAEGHAAARMMARLILVMGATPILAPTLGGLMLTIAPWRAIFGFGAVYGAVSGLLVCWLLPETLPPSHRALVGVAGAAQRYVSVLQDRGFAAYVAMGCGGMFGMFAYIGGSSPVLIEHFGFTPPEYGMLFSASAAFYIAGSQFAPLLLRRFGTAAVLRAAAAGFFAASCVFMLCAALGWGGVFGVVPPVMAVMGCMGLIMPSATVGALSRHAAQAGTASALMGTLQFGCAAVSGELVGLFSDGTPRPMATLVLVGAVAILIADRLRPRPQPALAASAGSPAER